MSEPFIGQIIQGGWNFAPRGYAFCNGQLISIAQNTALFSLLGTNYGGNGTTTFALPDLQGRSMVHWGNGAGLTPVSLGEEGGAENVTLLTANLPAHSHAVTSNPNAFNASTAKATDQQPSTGAIFGRGVDTGSGTAVPEVYLPAGTAATIALGLNIAGSINIAATGSNVPVAIRSPYTAVSVCIALEGIFPSRS